MLFVEAAKEYLKAFRHARSILLLISGGWAWLNSEFNLPWDLPEAALWILFAAALFGLQFWAFCDLWKSRNSLLRPHYDITLDELVALKTPKARNFIKETYDNPNSSNPAKDAGPASLLALFREIKQQAALGRLQVWGQQVNDHIVSDSSLQRIPPEAWENGRICYWGYLGDRRGELEQSPMIPDHDGFRDLRFDKAQALTVLSHVNEK